MSKINKDDVSTKVVADFLSKIIWAAASPIICGVGALIWSLFMKSSIATVIAILSLIVSVVTLVLMLWLQFRKNKNSRNSKGGKDSKTDEGIVPKFKAKTIEAEFYFLNREEMESRIEYNMRLTCPSMQEYPRDLVWSGSEYRGTSIAPEYVGDYEIEEKVGPQSPHEYLIKFNKEKSLGDSVEFKTITKVGDSSHIMKNYYSFTVKYQIEELILRVSAPKGLIKNVKKSVYADRGREIVVEAPQKLKRKIVGDLEEYTFIYSNPTLLYNYFIEWQFTNE